MPMKLEYRVRAVTRYIVTKHRVRDDGSTQTDECAEVSTLKGAILIAEGLAAAQSEMLDVTVVPYEGPPPGKLMRCKVSLVNKTPNVALAYVWRAEDAPGRFTEEPWEYERHGKTESGVSIRLDETDPANYRQDGVNVAFAAVWGGQAEDGKNAVRENRIFADATPNLSFVATIRNQAVTAALNVGDEFYVDFIPAPKTILHHES